ncbi:MAG: glycosyltransferase family 39 protein [bacterium]|nr:glycosyltransferase family 39 protein [bacterium]
MDYDEATYGLVVDETAKSGQILTLKTYDDKNWYEKPPLYFWISLAIKDFFIKEPELGLRLPAAISGILAVIGTMLIAYQVWKNYYISAISGIVLATTPIFLEASRQARLDIPVIASIVFGFYCFIRGLEHPRWLLGIGIFAAVGFLFKSVVGFLIFPIVLIWAILHRNYSLLRNLYFWAGSALMFLLLLPWHFYESFMYGQEFWNEYLLRHIFQRFSTDILGGTALDANYFGNLFWLGAPWAVLFVLIAVWRLTQNRKGFFSNKDIVALFAIIFFIFIIFEIARTKIFYYLLPMFPFMALAVAFLCSEIYQKIGGKQVKRYALVAFGLLAVIAISNTYYIAFHKQYDFYINQFVADEEKEVGLELAKSDLQKTYVFEYPYRETILYYSKGRILENMNIDQELTESFNLIVSKPLFDRLNFPPEVAKRLSTIWKGESVILLRFDYN